MENNHNVQNIQVDLSKYNSDFGLKNKIKRFIWQFCYIFLFRPFNLGIFRLWRIFTLKIFGANLHWSSNVYASSKIWAPWNLTMGAFSCIGPNVDCYNQGTIKIGTNTVISQKTYLCASSHDYKQNSFPLILKPIEIGNHVWVAADAFIGPGVIIADGTIIGARSAVFKNTESFSIYLGNPAFKIKDNVN